MELSNLHDESHKGHWHHGECDVKFLVENRQDQHALVEHSRIGLIVAAEERRRLNEATYKQLAQMIDGSFLSQAVRAKQLQGVTYRGFNGDTMRFDVRSQDFTSNHIVYQNLVQFVEWDETGSDNDLKNIEKARLLLWAGNIKLHCTCPSFLYWGYEAILTAMDAAIYPETRYPEVRNPGLRGIVCKHLNRVLSSLPFYSGDIAKELNNQFGG